MAYDFKSESEVKEFLQNISVEYRFGCYSERNPEACHLLGDYLESVKKDYEKARKVYKNNCDELSYGKSCLKYGTFSMLGKGGIKEDFQTAFQYYEKACNLNVPDACFNQGLLMLSTNAKFGVQPNTLKAISLLEKACIGNNQNACYYLSAMYITGIKKQPDEKTKKEVYELAKDMPKAFKYALKGCDLGHIYSCVNLSQMYARGNGVEKNQELADKYKKIALEMQADAMETNRTLNFQEGLS